MFTIEHDTEPVTVNQWLVAGTFTSDYLPANSNSAATRAGYHTDFLKEIGGVKNASIKTGTTITKLNGSQVKFSPKKFKKEYIDLLEVYGENASVCAYLYSEIECKKSEEFYFHVEINDAGKVWLNDILIIEHPLDGQAERSNEIAKIAFKKGINKVLMKIDQASGNWGAYFQVYGKTAHEKYIADKKEHDLGVDFDDPNCITTHLETKILCKQENRDIGW